MRVISFIEDSQVIKKILKHLGLWEVKPRPPPREIKAAPFIEPHIDYATRSGATGFPWSDMGLALSKIGVVKDSDG